MKLLLTAFLCLVSSQYLLAQENNWGKFSGQVFADYFYNIMQDGRFSDFNNTVIEGPKDFNGFVLRRASLNYDKVISDKFSARFRLEADSKSNTSNNKIGVFIKDASLKWKNIFAGSDLIIGIQPTPSFDVSEKYWGYRSLEKTIQDLRGFVPSRDFGIALRGNICETGNVNYTVMFGNNSANSPETDKYKRYYAAIDFMPINDFTIALTGDFKALPSKDDPENPGEKLSQNSILGSLFLGYAEKNFFSIGVEAVYQNNPNRFYKVGSDGLPELIGFNSMAFSVFGSYTFSETITGVLRYDYFNPVIDDAVLNDLRNYIIAGIDFKVDKNISIIPNVIYESYQETTGRTKYDPSVTGRVTLYYNF